jgi:hypothetical protein
MGTLTSISPRMKTSLAPSNVPLARTGCFFLWRMFMAGQSMNVGDATQVLSGLNLLQNCSSNSMGQGIGLIISVPVSHSTVVLTTAQRPGGVPNVSAEFSGGILKRAYWMWVPATARCFDIWLMLGTKTS